MMAIFISQNGKINPTQQKELSVVDYSIFKYLLINLFIITSD